MEIPLELTIQPRRRKGAGKLLCMGLLALIQAGCHSARQFVPLPSTAEAPSANVARIYVFHREGSGIFPVVDGTKLIGHAPEHRYVGWEREAGTATLVTGMGMLPLRIGGGFGRVVDVPHDPGLVFTEPGKRKPKTVFEAVSRNVKVEGGKTYFVVLDGPGWSTHPVKIQVVDEATGNRLVTKAGKPRVKMPDGP
jgi:hypothetical protein